MAEFQIASDGESIERQEEKKTTRTVDDINRLWQGRFDILRQEKEEVESKLNELNGKKAAASEAVGDIMDRRERIFTHAVDRGFDPKIAMEVIGVNDLSVEERIDKLVEMQIETKRATTEEFAKRHGRKVVGASRPHVDLTYDGLNRMTDAQINRLPAETITRAIDNAAKENKPTLRDRLKGHKL